MPQNCVTTAKEAAHSMTRETGCLSPTESHWAVQRNLSQWWHTLPQHAKDGLRWQKPPPLEAPWWRSAGAPWQLWPWSPHSGSSGRWQTVAEHSRCWMWWRLWWRQQVRFQASCPEVLWREASFKILANTLGQWVYLRLQFLHTDLHPVHVRQGDFTEEKWRKSLFIQ